MCKLTTSKIKDHFHAHIFDNNKRGKEMPSMYNAGRIHSHYGIFFFVVLGFSGLLVIVCLGFFVGLYFLNYFFQFSGKIAGFEFL